MRDQNETTETVAAPHPDRSEAYLRLECLREAAHALGTDPERVIQAARQYADFVLGTKDAAIVAAAREFADRVK